MLADAEQADDVGMAKLAQDVGLALEALDRLGVFAHAGQHDLDGDALAGLGVGAAVDGTHGAGAELLLDGERPDLLSNQHETPSVLREGCELFLW